MGLQAAPLAQVQLSLQFRPHVPLGHGKAQSRPCHPEGREGGCYPSSLAQHSFLPAPQICTWNSTQTTASQIAGLDHVSHKEPTQRHSKAIAKAKLEPRSPASILFLL